MKKVVFAAFAVAAIVVANLSVITDSKKGLSLTDLELWGNAEAEITADPPCSGTPGDCSGWETDVHN